MAYTAGGFWKYQHINKAKAALNRHFAIAHMVRNSLRFVSWKDYKAIARGLKNIYSAIAEKNTLIALTLFEKMWLDQYLEIALVFVPLKKEKYFYPKSRL